MTMGKTLAANASLVAALLSVTGIGLVPAEPQAHKEPDGPSEADAKRLSAAEAKRERKRAKLMKLEAGGKE